MSRIENLENIIASFPGLGIKTSRRIVLKMLENKEFFFKNFAEKLIDAYENIKICLICGNISDDNPCKICTSIDRDDSLLCIVETIADMYNIERSNSYYGKYHILGGRLSAAENMTPDKLSIKSLENRVKNGNFSEIILATSSTINGQTTMFYIYDFLLNLQKIYHKVVKISTLAKGIPIGLELDYIDEITIGSSIKDRTSLDI